MCTCEIQHGEETLVRWSRREQITCLVVPVVDNKNIRNTKAGHNNWPCKWGIWLKLLFLKVFLMNVRYRAVVQGGEEEYGQQLVSWYLLADVLTPTYLKWSDAIRLIATSLLEKASFRYVVRTDERVFFFLGGGAGSHHICSSHFYVSNRLSAPGRFRLNKLPGEPVFVLEGSSNIQRPLRSLNQNTNPQRLGPQDTQQKIT